MANITITQIDNTITANSTTDVINVTETRNNVIVSSTTITEQINLSNVTVPIESNSNISTDANITADYIIANTAIVGDFIGDVYAADGTSKILENGTDGSDAVFTGDVTGEVSSIANFTTSDLTEGSNLYYTTDRANTAITNFQGSISTPGDISADEHNSRLARATEAFSGPEIAPIFPSTTFTVRASTTALTGGLDVNQSADIGGGLDVNNGVIAADVRSRSLMYLNAGNQGNDAFIYVDRVGGNADPSDAYIKWNETTGNWEAFDGANTRVFSANSDVVDATFGNVEVLGNLQVQGNLNYVNVEDLFVNDRSLTLNNGNVLQDAFINIDRSGINNGENLANFSVSANVADPTGMTFNSNGTKLYVVGSSEVDVYQYSLSSAYDVSTATFEYQYTNTSIAADEPSGIAFNDNGTKMYITMGDVAKIVYYSLSSAYDLSTASFDGQYTAQSGNDLAWNSDGTKLFLMQGSLDGVRELNLTTAYDLSGTVTSGTFANVAAQDTNMTGIGFNSVGSKMYLTGKDNDAVYQYALTSAFDISTYSYDGINLDVSSEDGTPESFAINNSDDILFILGASTEKVYDYQLNQDAYIKWNETTDGWQIYDGTTTYNLPAAGDIESVTAGSGLTGGGDTGNVTLNVGAGTGITVNADNVAVDMSAFTTSDLTEGTNLYFTDDRARAAVSASGDLTYNASTGVFSVTTYKTADFNTDFATKTTTDLTEGANLYYTDDRARAAVSAADDLSYNSTTGVFSVTTYKTADFNTDFATKTTTDLTEGTNLYYTTDRANAAIGAYQGDINTAGNITAGVITATTEFFGDLDGAVSANVYNDTASTINKGKAVYLTGGNQGDQPHVAEADNTNPTHMPALGVVKENISAGAEGQVVTSGVMNFSAHGFTAGADLYVNGSGDLTETVPTSEAELIQKIGKVVSPNHIIVQGAFRTNATPNLDEGNIFLGSSSDTAITVTPDSNFETTGNAFSLSNSLTDVNKITSETSTELTLFGQSQVGVNQLVDSTESRIVDLTTTGYGVNSFDFGTANVTTDNIPALFVYLIGSSGTNTATAYSLSPGNTLKAIGQTTAGYTDYSAFVPGVNPAVTLGGYAMPIFGANTKGWILYDVAADSTINNLPSTAYVSDVTGDVVTFSENLSNSINGQFILFPGAHSTTQNIHMSLTGDDTTTGIPYVTSKVRTNNYDLPETLSNVTLDAVSYGDSTVDMANVIMRHMADLTTGPDSAVRTDRLLLIGANATPDVNSIGEDDLLPGPTALGLTLENDGLTFEAEVNTAPVTKFLINQFNENGLNSFTEYPEWTEFLGESGNAAVDMKYLGSPTFQFKTIGGTKEDKKPIQDTDVVGRITWSPVIPGGSGGSDAFHPPASIVARVPGDTAANATISNVDVHFQSTYATSYRNGANTAAGTIPRTFLSSNEGSTVLAAKPDGSIQLKPQRDYGDSADSTSFVENRFAHELHDYHTFLSAQFGNTTAKTGTLITIQPDSGETGGTTDFNYDSKGDAVLRLQTNLSNGSARYNYDITHAEDTETLTITSGAGNTEHLSISSDNRIKLSNVMRLNPLSNSAILALSPNEAGDVVYSTDANKVCYYNGTSWKTIDDNTDIV